MYELGISITRRNRERIIELFSSKFASCSNSSQTLREHRSGRLATHYLWQNSSVGNKRTIFVKARYHLLESAQGGVDVRRYFHCEVNASATVMRLSKYLFSSQPKRSKIFSPALAFSFCFHLSTLMRFTRKQRLLDMLDALSPIVHFKTPENADWSDRILRLFRRRF